MASTPSEQWRTSPSHPSYEVSDQGRVRRSKPGQGAIAGRVLRPGRNGDGYLTVHLHGRSQYVHVLVAEAFIGPVPPGGQVDHLSADRGDSRLSNLKVHPTKLAHLERHRRRPDSTRRRHGERNERVDCECGCGAVLWRFSRDGRRRRYVSGHNLQRAA